MSAHFIPFLRTAIFALGSPPFARNTEIDPRTYPATQEFAYGIATQPGETTLVHSVR